MCEDVCIYVECSPKSWVSEWSEVVTLHSEVVLN